jgi:hypothetical protein
MQPCSVLPPELLDRIIWYLRTPIRDMKALHALSLVSRAWNASAQLWIFHRIHVWTEVAPNFLDLVSAHPHILTHVRVLSLSFDYDLIRVHDRVPISSSRVVEKPGWMGVLAALAGKLPSLESLHISHLLWSASSLEIRLALASHFGHIRSLHLYKCDMERFHHLDSLLRRFRHLDNLDYSDINFSKERSGTAGEWRGTFPHQVGHDGDDDACDTVPIPLRTLRLETRHWLAPVSEWARAHLVLANLVELELCQVTMTHAEAIGRLFQALGPFGSLRRLRLRPRFWNNDPCCIGEPVLAATKVTSNGTRLLDQIQAHLDISPLTELRVLELEPTHFNECFVGDNAVGWIKPFLSNLRARELERVAFLRVFDVDSHVKAFPFDAVDTMFGTGRFRRLKEVEVQLMSGQREPRYAEFRRRMPRLMKAGLLRQTQG